MDEFGLEIDRESRHAESESDGLVRRVLAVGEQTLGDVLQVDLGIVEILSRRGHDVGGDDMPGVVEYIFVNQCSPGNLDRRHAASGVGLIPTRAAVCAGG